MKELFEYNNFWLIWLNCAGSKKGISLFKIQESWGIKTNYLYHKERRLDKPLFKAMIEAGYICEGEKGFVAEFDWIPSYILKNHNLKSDDTGWSLNDFIVETMPIVTEFIKNNNAVLFDSAFIKQLYLSDINTIKRDGPTIFDDVMLFVFIYNLIPFCKRYDAEIVIRMIYTFFAFSSQKDFLNYFNDLNHKLPKDAVPEIIANEGELIKVLCPIDLSRDL
ncbi:MAG: hypothetical protein GQ477_00635 [Nanohaloarchaea archaeon]|nr:hypothetical protein [Candidatus Nanohaloarchaea archaeon]